MKASSLLQDNTEKVAAESFSLQLKYADGIPPTGSIGQPRGYLRFEAGDRVKTTGIGVIKAGLSFTIKEGWLENGFERYLVEGTSLVIYGEDLK